ncbi:hypothetical protein K431DRAFT_281723 [Polychaeton citri CBS 116435]|uniref:DUF7053 domain-containing protein n=1 Tax=Polychaeton citri CBS 116435 TaxID=1314669 RepID=A0A9P4QCL5_9PEZI|nr:hypothetical protein K431DRAFT_281723 [Polychaeton citri CBS 116435]
MLEGYNFPVDKAGRLKDIRKHKSKDPAMFRANWTDIITDPIPPNIKPQAVTDFLHDHVGLINLSPIVTRHQRKEASSPEEGEAYDVWENIDLLPLGLWKHEIHFSVSFADTPDGVVSFIDAPLGLQSKATYMVRRSNPDGPADVSAPQSPQAAERGPDREAMWDGGWVLEERVESSVSVFFKLMVEGQLVPTRKTMHQRLLKKVEERLHGGDAAELPTARDQ